MKASSCLLAVCLLACAGSPRGVAERGVQVRLDAVARALARARAQHEQGCPARHCDRSQPPQRELEQALAHAELTLEQAQRAADRWAAGDGRRFARLRPRLAEALQAVARALEAGGHPVPPGLCELFPVGRY
jgi:hypothetical protein